jgi:signal transduction histidine kinase
VTPEAAIDVNDTRVLGVESKLSRLLINLLSNALQHSPAGDTVRVGLKRRGHEIHCPCRTTGLASPRKPGGGSLSGSSASILPAAVSRGGRDWDWRSPRRLPDAMAE